MPLYIQIPYLYTRGFGVPLAWVSGILLATRLLDAILDPLLGVSIDGWKNKRGYIAPIVMSAPLLLIGMWGVFLPFGTGALAKAASLGISLIIVHLGYSLAMIAYQSWGAELGATDEQRSQFVATREAIGIAGVIVAVSLPASQHAQGLLIVFAISLIIGLFFLLRYSPRPAIRAVSSSSKTKQPPEAMGGLLIPLSRPAFRILLLVFLVNGVAGALPATLVPFFLRDRLQLPESTQWTLGVYFLVGALSTLVWVPLANRLGLVKCWMLGMLFTVAGFIGVTVLAPGQLYGFLFICILTGIALGADLAFPATLLAKVIELSGDKGRREGTYFGLWNWVNKFNLAVAPAAALPLLGFFGYHAEGSNPVNHGASIVGLQNTDALLVVYAIIPCALKLLALLVIWFGDMLKLDQQALIPAEPLREIS